MARLEAAVRRGSLRRHHAERLHGGPREPDHRACPLICFLLTAPIWRFRANAPDLFPRAGIVLRAGHGEESAALSGGCEAGLLTQETQRGPRPERAVPPWPDNSSGFPPTSD
jgi:hypothetical protein